MTGSARSTSLTKDRGTDVLNLLSKSEPRLGKDEQKIHDLLKKHKDDEEVQFAFEIAVMEAMLVDAAYYQDEIIEKIKRRKKDAVDKRQRTIMKMVAKRAANGTLTPETYALAKELIRKELIRVQEHTREDGTTVAEHWRKLPEGHKARSGQTWDEYKEQMQEAQEQAAALAEQQSEQMLASVDQALEGATSGFEAIGESASVYFDKDQILQGIATLPESIDSIGQQAGPGMSEFFSGETWGERIVRGAEFLSKTGSKLAVSAKVISDFGPFLGMRMLHSYFRYGGYDVPLKKHGESGMPPENASKEEVYNWAINSLRTGKGASSKGMPNNREWQLAGDHMPSEGFFVNGDGVVTAHAVGRGKDHFLPFNLKHLRQMKQSDGGMMIRRRAAGGITVEDLHVGMMMGLDQVTVISNNGVFSLNIDNRAKGIRSEHMQILNRYQDLVNLHAHSRTKGRAGFDAYDIALGAIALEFPLHLSKHETIQAPASEMFFDRARPQTTLVDDFRDLFNNLNPFRDNKKNRTQGASSAQGMVSTQDGHHETPDGKWVWKTNAQGDREYNQSIFPGRRKNEAEDQWAKRASPTVVSRAMEELGRWDREHHQTSTTQSGQQAKKVEPAGKIFNQSWQGTGGTTYDRDRRATDSPQRRDNPVTVARQSDLTPEQQKKANEELRQKQNQYLENERRLEEQAPPGRPADVFEHPEDTSTEVTTERGLDDLEGPTEEELEYMEILNGGDDMRGSTLLPKSSRERGVLRDMIDDAEDYDGVDGPWGYH